MLSRPNPMKLTIGERIALHLYGFRSYREEFVVPRSVTQDGIGLELGISRAHAAIELKRMLGTGMAETRLAHVKGLGTRRATYFLSPKGEEDARSLIDLLETEGIKAEAMIAAPAEKRVKASLSNEISKLRVEVLTLRNRIELLDQRIAALESQETILDLSMPELEVA